MSEVQVIAYPEVRCIKCHVLLFYGWMHGEIKCRSCGTLQEIKPLGYNMVDETTP